MPAQMTHLVHVTTLIPDAEPIVTVIGTATTPAKGRVFGLADAYETLGELLVASGRHCLEQGSLPSQG
ncbi:hypothetical protein [Streptomyces sp. NPDC059883]|uniref:hypothetical protein n=1 Tax=unclassified Streptomyces TaxID=2593676 RepID=UPI00365E6FC1